MLHLLTDVSVKIIPKGRDKKSGVGEGERRTQYMRLPTMWCPESFHGMTLQ